MKFVLLWISIVSLLVSADKQYVFRPRGQDKITEEIGSIYDKEANEDAFPLPSGGRPLCDPILHAHQDARQNQQCILPMPNNFYLKTSNETPTGYQVDIPRRALPKTRFNLRFDPADWNQRDGWSASTFIVLSGLSESVMLEWSHVNATDDDGLHDSFHGTGDSSHDSFHGIGDGLHDDFHGKGDGLHDGATPHEDFSRIPPSRKKPAEGGPDLYSFASHAYLGRSTERESPILLIDAETGEKVPHWVMLDHSWAVKYLNPNGPLFNGSDEWMNNNNGTSTYSDHLEKPTRLSDADIHTMDSKKWLTETFMIHPARRLNSIHRYIVAMRNLRSRTRRKDDGTPELVEGPEGFRIIRDGKQTIVPLC